MNGKGAALRSGQGGSRGRGENASLAQDPASPGDVLAEPVGRAHGVRDLDVPRGSLVEIVGDRGPELRQRPLHAPDMHQSWCRRRDLNSYDLAANGV